MIGTWSRSLIHAADVEAGHAGKHEVEHDHVGTEGAELFQPLFTRPGGNDVVALMPQRQFDGIADIRVVFDNKDSRHLDSVRRRYLATAPERAPPGACYRRVIRRAVRYLLVTFRTYGDHLK